MKQSTKAVLLSGLVFPGIGHMVLRRYRRAAVLMAAAMLATAVLVTVAIKRALSIVDRINSGEIPLDTTIIAEQVASSSADGYSLWVTIAVVVFCVCWLVGVVDAYRIGAALEK